MTTYDPPYKPYEDQYSYGNVSYEFNPNWPTGKFIQILVSSEGEIVALDDMGDVWIYRIDKKAWLQFPQQRIPFITTEDKDDDED